MNTDNTNNKHIQAVKTIQDKLKGKELSYVEIFNIMDEISKDRLDDVLTTYFVAAGYRGGFTSDELYYMTKAMVETGTQMSFEGIVADKHSTGGLPGTRTTLIVVPIIAAAGFKIPKTSSRAITTPAGTADVMELFSEVTFTPHKIESIVKAHNGCIVWGGKLGIAPADDIIIRVEEPLSFESFDKIIVSIMAKKIAVGTNHLVLDIPYGPNIKIHRKQEAEMVAAKFSELARKFKIKLYCYVNYVSQPAGTGIGAYIEAVDAMKVLQQTTDRPQELEEKAITLAGKLLDLCYESTETQLHGSTVAREILRSGKALRKFQDIVEAQGGKKDVVYTDLVSKAFKVVIPEKQSGTIKKVNIKNLSLLAKVLSAPEDKYSGIKLFKERGDKVQKGEDVLELHSSNKHNIKEVEQSLDHFPIYVYE